MIIETIQCFLSQYRWFRKLMGGEWVYLRIDLGDRPMFWTKINLNMSLSDGFAHSHTILEREDWRGDRP